MMRFLKALAWIVTGLGTLGALVLFGELSRRGLEAPLCFGITVAAWLECVIVAAILFAMAEGLRLLERIAAGQTKAIGIAALGTQAVCPRCLAQYPPGRKYCERCGIELVQTAKERAT